MALLLGVSLTNAVAQESESTTVTTTTSGGEVDFFGPFNVNDATPLATGQLDLRLRYDWTTGRDRPNADDDHVGGVTLLWGPCSNVEVSLDLPVNLGDSGDMDGGFDGNADVYLGVMYRFLEDQGDWMPAMAFSATARIPTGDRSSGVDGNFRLLLTKEYDSGLRSHVNGFVITANGDNEPDTRHFQWGVVIGMDGPLCADGAVRWVADYMHRSSVHDHESNGHILEIGTEWTAADNCKLGMAAQIALDHNGEVPDFGARLNWSYSLMR
ncbi:MAG: hypothetical protein C4547_12360 [Phycisphaerales bacterium]|nr:MAG: hypothetical protein C4547_12360 [Phycisphaerales bacterium]